jgi:hypothetical protein
VNSSPTSKEGASTEMERDLSFYFWKFVHNGIIHPLLAFPYEPRWLQRAHDWTAKKCWGAG